MLRRRDPALVALDDAALGYLSPARSAWDQLGRDRWPSLHLVFHRNRDLLFHGTLAAVWALHRLMVRIEFTAATPLHASDAPRLRGVAYGQRGALDGRSPAHLDGRTLG